MTGTAVKGTFGVGFEPSANPGKQTIFSPQALTAAANATNQPQFTGTQGVRLQIIVLGVAAGASTTITIAGLKPDGVTVATETTTGISTATADVNGNYTYTTKATYGTINASGITATSYAGSLSGASVAVYGIVASKYLVPAIALFEEEETWVSPPDFRGVLDEDIRMLQLLKKTTFDIKSAFYPESDQWFALAAVANAANPATPASVPASPTVLKAATAFSVLGASFTLTTAPTNPGMLLQCVVAGSNALAGTLTITGTAWYTGETQSEVVSVPTISGGSMNGTFYSQFSYQSVTSIAITGFTSTATLAVNGVYAYNPVYNPTDTLISLAGEWYSGTESAVYPWMVPETFAVTYDVTKDLAFEIKGLAQDKCIIGDQTVTNLTTSNFGTYAQPLDYPIPSWPGQFYIDPIGGTAGTTLSGDIITFKINGATGLVPYWTGVGSQQYNRVGRKRRKTTFEAEIDFTNVLQYGKYRAGAKQIFTAKFLSPFYLGAVTTPQYKYVQFILNARMTKFDIDPKDEKVMAKVSGTCEYDSGSGYAFQVSFLNQNNPNYAV